MSNTQKKNLRNPQFSCINAPEIGPPDKKKIILISVPLGEIMGYKQTNSLFNDADTTNIVHCNPFS